MQYMKMPVISSGRATGTVTSIVVCCLIKRNTKFWVERLVQTTTFLTEGNTKF